jgi:hypothetical protein
MALLFSFSLAMDKLVIGRVVTPIEYLPIQFSFGLAVANQKEVARALQNGYLYSLFLPI